MEDVKITIRNYRNIPYNNPLSFEIGEGITFILGVNNIGKSNLLRIFYELRYTFMQNINQEGIYGGDISPLFFSNIKNQDSEESTITILIQSKDGSKNIEALVEGTPLDLDHSNYTGRIIFTGYDRNNAQSFYRQFSDTMYIGSFRTPTFQVSGQYYDIQIGRSFIEIWDSWANGQNTSQRRKISTLKKELKDIFGFEHFDIYPNQGNSNLIVETDDGSFTLDELGGGISHYILVLANALIRNPGFILIDEPENGLHPKMQETFVRTLASKAKYGLVATSHSIGLARSVGSDRIYFLNKGQNGRLKMSNYGENYRPSLLNSINELGYSQFVEIGGNNILLVEGSTDIKCFKEILRKYGIEHHFIIMGLGGSSLISAERHDEISELKRLNAKSYNVIFDSEISRKDEPLSEKLQAFKEMCEELGFNVFPTEYHSTDNYITQEAINKELGDKYTALSSFENLNNRWKDNKWGKSLNWKMFKKMDKSDFEGTELDKFITQTLVPLTK